MKDFLFFHLTHKFLKNQKSLGFLIFLTTNHLLAQLTDSTGMAIEEIDLNYIVDGGDTVFIKTEDTIFEMMHLSEPINYSMEVKLSSNIASMDPGLFGSNIADIFSRKHEPEGVYGIDQWQLLSDLRPNVIRIMSGGSSTLMHLLHHPTLDSDANGENDPSQGYGYVIEEIVNYFDYADGEWDALSITDILNENIRDEAVINWGDPDNGWIEDGKLAGQCFDYVQKYKDQVLLPAGTRYLDSFIRLIQKIENENEGLRVKVIVCLNIVSETADECKAIVEYLRDAELNGIYGVNVYGVEMGNECYDTFFQKVMGFTTFDFYYGYLNGETVPGFDVDAVLRPGMEDEGHQFLQVFKNDIDFDCKVGVVGDDNPDHSDNSFVLKRDDEIPELVIPDWNTQISSHYNALIPVSGTAFSRKAFDAVILHPYYGIDNFKHEIVDLNYLNETYSCITDGPIWNYSSYDSRLQTAYNFMTDKFISLFRMDFKSSFIRWGEDLGFYSGASPSKELWTTEWNYKDVGNIEIGDENRMGAFSNSFFQGILVLEWDLKNLKINYDPSFRNHFMPISTYHNFGGGGNTEMLNLAEKRELVYYNLNPADWMTADLCDETYWVGGTDETRHNYFVKHTPYFAHELMSDIYTEGLDYMKTNFVIAPALLTDNLQPTVFIDPLKTYICLVYSNARGHNQNYVLNTNGMLDLFPEATDILLGTPFVKCLDAKFPYSTAGRSTLYELNTCYSSHNAPEDCNDNSAAEPYPMELSELEIADPLTPECGAGVPEEHCVTVPAYSMGYIKIYFEPRYEEKENQDSQNIAFQIYPNPATDYLGIVFTGAELKTHIKYAVYSAEGLLIKTGIIANNEKISISDLAAGCYAVVLNCIDSISSQTTFVKL